MTDSIEDDDVRRVDQNVDPTALNPDDIEQELPDDFSSGAKQAFAERVAQERDPVRDSVDLSKRISRNPSSGQPQLRGPDGRMGPSADKVTGTSLDSDGSYYAELEGGDRFKVDTVDLNAGSSEGRADNW
jgi:hypothetical protein